VCCQDFVVARKGPMYAVEREDLPGLLVSHAHATHQ
jgi:hypothetical protein